MSWLNNLSNIKGQITSFANEVLSEGNEEDQKPHPELDEANRRLLELQNIVINQNAEIANLRKQNAEISRKEPDRHRAAAVAGPSGAQNVRSMEDSWIWTEDDVESEETPSHEEKKRRSDSAELKTRILELEQENQNLSSNLEELDTQHNVASQKLVEIKNELQKKYEDLMEELRVAKSNQKNHAQVEQLKEENSRLKIDFDKIQEDLSILQDENFELQRLTNDLKASGASIIDKNNESQLQVLKKKQEELINENERLKIDLDKVDEDRSVLQDDNFALQEEIENLKKKAPSPVVVASMEALKSENLELKAQIGSMTKFKAELDMAKKKETDLKHENERLKIDYGKVQDDMSTLQDENFELQEEIEMLKNSACSSDMTENFESLKKENSDLKIEIEKSLHIKGEFDILKKKEADLTCEIERLKIDIDKVDDDRNVLQDQNFELQEQLKILQSDSTSNKDSKDIEKLKQENDNLRIEIKKLSSLTIEIQDLRKNDASLRKEIDSLKTEVDQINIARNALQVCNLELQEEISKTRSLLSDKNITLESLQAENVELKKKYEENSTLKKELESVMIKETHLKQEYERLKVDIDKAEEDRSVLQDTNFELQEEIRILKTNTSSTGSVTSEVLRKENEELKKEIERNSRIKIDYEKVEEDFCVLQDQNLEYQGHIANLNTKIEEQLSEIEMLKHKIATSAIENYNENEKKLTEQSEQYERLKVDYEKVQEDLSVLQDENFELQQKISECCDKTLVELLEKEIQNLNDEKKSLGVDLDKVKDDLSILQTENIDLQRRLSTVCENSEQQKNQSDSNEAESLQKDDFLRELQEKNNKLKAEKQALNLELAHYEKECNELMKNSDRLFLELEDLKASKLQPISENNEESFLNLEQQLENCSTLNQSLEDMYKSLEEKLEKAETEKKQLTDKFFNKNKDLEVTESNLKEVREHLKIAEQENNILKAETNKLRTNINLSLNQNTTEQSLQVLYLQYKQLTETLHSTQQEQQKLLQENVFLKGELQRTIQNLEERNPKIQILDSKSGRIQNINESGNDRLKQELQTAIDTIESLKQQNVELYNKSTTELQNSKAIEITLRHQIDELKQQLLEADANRNMLESTFKNLEIPKAEELHTQFMDMKAKYENALRENENINRLMDQSTLFEEKKQLENAYGVLLNEKNELIKFLTAKHEENVTYHAEIQRLTGLLQAEISQKTQSGIDPTSLEKLKDQVEFLREKCDILTNSLVTEQSNVKLLNQEKREAEERAVSSSRELERLRQHLVEVEQSHTQEIMELDMRNNELQTKISNIEEHAIYNNTAYTSASIRANQQAETLQVQLTLMSQQRDELLTKMSDTEDKYNKQIAALTNLQCALEQFQRDKEQDIQHSTERLRAQLEREQREQAILRIELTALRTQLAEQQQGLMAAGRLAEQLEASHSVVQALKLDLKQSQDKYAALQTKVESAQSNQADKIEKSLIKNLMLGYITSGQHNDKAQILKIISAVLDFNQSECDRIGLNSSQKSSWFGGSLLRLGEEGLAKAFVEFLEKESLPRSKESSGLSLLQIPHENPAAVSKPSDSGQASTSGTVQAAPGNALLSQATHADNVLPTFAPPRSASSILKDVLKDNNT